MKKSSKFKKIIFCLIISIIIGGCRAKRSQDPNIILITIDTLRADQLSGYGYGRKTTPFLDRLAERGNIFNNCYASSSWTSPSMASLFTGLYPRSHGVQHGFIQRGKIVNQERLDDSFITLAEALKAHGYSTFGISTNGHVTPETGMAQGFDEFISLWFPDAPAAHEAALKLREKLQNSPPYFFWIYYFDPHAPYRAREPWIKRYSNNLELARKWAGALMKQLRRKKSEIDRNPDVLSALVNLYDSEINYTDHFIEKLFREVLSEENCLIIVTSDHGEGFMEHRLIGHGNSLFEEVVKVPLIIKLPEEEEFKGSVPEPVSIVDVYPTILDYLKIPIPVQIQGKSLLPYLKKISPGKRSPVFCELDRGRKVKSIRMGKWKLIRKARKKKGRMLFDLKADPGEKMNLTKEEPAVAQRLAAHLKHWQEQYPEFKAPREEGEMSKEEVKILKSLGYIQ